MHPRAQAQDKALEISCGEFVDNGAAAGCNSCSLSPSRRWGRSGGLPPPPLLPPPPPAPAEPHSSPGPRRRQGLSLREELEGVERSLFTLLEADREAREADVRVAGSGGDSVGVSSCDGARLLSEQIRQQLVRLASQELRRLDQENAEVFIDKPEDRVDMSHGKCSVEVIRLREAISTKAKACQERAGDVRDARLAAQSLRAENEALSNQLSGMDTSPSNRHRIVRQKHAFQRRLMLAKRDAVALKAQISEFQAQTDEAQAQEDEAARQLQDEHCALVASQERHGRLLWATAARRSLSDATAKSSHYLRRRIELDKPRCRSTRSNMEDEEEGSHRCDGSTTTAGEGNCPWDSGDATTGGEDAEGAQPQSRFQAPQRGTRVWRSWSENVIGAKEGTASEPEPEASLMASTRAYQYDKLLGSDGPSVATTILKRESHEYVSGQTTSVSIGATSPISLCGMKTQGAALKFHEREGKDESLAWRASFGLHRRASMPSLPTSRQSCVEVLSQVAAAASQASFTQSRLGPGWAFDRSLSREPVSMSISPLVKIDRRVAPTVAATVSKGGVVAAPHFSRLASLAPTQQSYHSRRTHSVSPPPHGTRATSRNAVPDTLEFIAAQPSTKHACTQLHLPFHTLGRSANVSPLPRARASPPPQYLSYVAARSGSAASCPHRVGQSAGSLASSPSHGKVIGCHRMVVSARLPMASPHHDGFESRAPFSNSGY